MRFFTIPLMLLAAGSLSQALQDKPAEETREVRIYLLDRTTPERALKDAAAVLTLERKSGRGETILFPRATKDSPALPEGAPPGMIRGLISSPYFVELNVGDASARPGETVTPEKANGHAAPNPPPSSQEILRRARKGTWFSKKLPASVWSEPFTATITIRMGNMTLTSEEFQGPQAAPEKPEETAARVDRALETLRERAKESAGFMDLKPIVEELQRELSKLAPAGFEDGTGAVEKDRQWCLALARAMEQACYGENLERIQELSRQCEPRMKAIHDQLAKSRGKEPEPAPPPAPEPPPTVK